MIKLTKPVLFAVILSSLSLAIAYNGHATRTRSISRSEPSAPVSGLATLVSVQDSAEGRFAIMRINLVAHMSDVAATVQEFDNTLRQPRGAPVGSFDLKKGEEQTFSVRVAVPRDRESELFYRVNARASDGSYSDLLLYNRVPPDDPAPCLSVGDYIQCPGQTVTEVQP